jgi:hypothetical protein
MRLHRHLLHLAQLPQQLHLAQLPQQLQAARTRRQ